MLRASTVPLGCPTSTGTPYTEAENMQHRHINDIHFSFTAIDSIIERGKVEDWIELREKIAKNHEIAEAVIHVCAHRRKDEFLGRLYIFWYHYAQAKVWEKTDEEKEDAVWSVIYKSFSIL
jgi:hypothetical protein